MKSVFVLAVFAPLLVTAQIGFLVQQSHFSVQETIDRLDAEIAALPPVNVALRVDHQAAAARVGLVMRPNTVLLFGNPLVGTPIMGEQQSAGIDLPLRVSSWQDEGGDVWLGYSDPVEWLGPRHEVVGQLEVLGTMSGLLATITASAAGNLLSDHKKPLKYFASKSDRNQLAAAEGIIAKLSPFTVSETMANLTQALLPTPIEVQLRVDHAAAAASVGLFLRPTEALIFGNPSLGTLLMQSEAEIGFDLPLKAASFQDENGFVWLIYNDIEYLASRFNIIDQAQTVISISQALNMFTDIAIGQGSSPA